jgi:RNA polymerase sigma factor
VERQIVAARRGEAQAREELVRWYLPLVLRVTARACGRYVQLGRDDEVSVALMAFNEAIDRYQSDSGASFASFAEMVIRRRLVDHFRREGARRELPLTELETENEEGEVANPVEAAGAVALHRREQEAQDLRSDVRRFREALEAYGISLQDLVRVSPQHEDARRRAAAVARAVARNPVWRAYLRHHRALPLKEMERANLGVSRKTLERQRKYIIALALVWMEELDSIRSFLPEA